MSSTKSKSGKGKPNAFLFFMLEYRQNEANEGNQMDMIQTQAEAGKIWEVSEVSTKYILVNLKLCYHQTMSTSEKAKYFDKVPNGPTSKGPTKYTSFGVSFEEIDRQKHEAKRQHELMNLTIEDMIDTAKERGGECLFISSLLSIHINYFPLFRS
jgi:hypothetical protein